MNQVLHIFKKDARHCWPQITLLFLILVAYTWSEVRSWQPGDYVQIMYRSFLSPATVLLMIAGWWSLLGRSIQDEKLVGDKQFWVTRPYRWPELLGAKLLFVLTFINFPLLVVQLNLLAFAGFSPWRYLPGVLRMQLNLCLMLILPIAALATVTSTLGQVLLMLLGAGVYLIAVGFLGTQTPSGFPTGETVFNVLSSAVLVSGCVVAILWQYSRRWTSRSRGLLTGCAVLIPLVMVTLPYDALINRDFPPLAAGQPVPLQLTLDPARGVPRGGPEAGKEVNIFLPMLAAGVSNDAIVEITGQKIVVEGPNGFHWGSGWERTYRTLYPWSSRADGGFRMPRSSFDEIKDKEVRARIIYTLTVRRSTGPQQVTAVAGVFEIAPATKCALSAALGGSLQCGAPLSHPPLLVTADLSADTCPLPQQQRADKAFTWVAAASTYGAISPVQRFGIILEGRETTVPSGWEANPGICPGTKLEVRTMEPVQRVRSEVVIENIKLGSYRWDPMFGGGSFGIDIHRD